MAAAGCSSSGAPPSESAMPSPWSMKDPSGTKAAIYLLLLVPAWACQLHSPKVPITVYSRELDISLPVPQGWSSQAGDQAGFHMLVFTGPSVDVPDRPGIRVQVMAGAMPEGARIDELARRYTAQKKVIREQGYSLHGEAGKTWFFVSGDGAEKGRLMLAPVEGTLYGLYAYGEAGTVDAQERSLDAMWQGYSIEKAKFFESYQRPDFGLFLKHPGSWKRTGFVSEPGQSLFVSFRSPPLAVERDGTSVHATLEVTVRAVPADTTLESFYAERSDALGDNYRLLRHAVIEDGKGISDLYHIETQLADYFERTIYHVSGGMSYIFKFNTRNQVYKEIEGWIDEIASTFETSGTAWSSER